MLNTISHGPIQELQLARPPVNALNGALVRALLEALGAARDAGAEGLILSGGDGIFSAGLDLPELLTLDPEAMHAFWRDFFRLAAALATAPMPVVAAVSGHSPAGGAVLAVLCDYRVMADGPFRIGLNETHVGLVVPECIQLALRRLTGAYRAERLLVAGAMLEAAEARACGMVDELAPPARVRTRARAWLEELLALPGHAMRATRAIARADLAAAFADPDRLPIADYVTAWFQPETQAVLRQVVAQLGSGRARD